MVANYLDDLLVFARVVDLRTFTAVANSLGMPLSAVSKQISRLEENIGARLLNRTTHGVSPTEIGRAVYEHAIKITEQSKAIDNLIKVFQTEPVGLLRVTSPVGFGNAHIAPYLPEFQSKYPDISVSLELDNQYLDVVENGMDVAIRIANNIRQNLMVRPLGKIRYALCASNDYIRTFGLPRTLDDLKGHNCLIYGRFRTHDTWHFSDQTGAHFSAKVSGKFVVNSTDALRSLALQNQGIALLPSFCVGDDIKNGSLRALIPELTPQGAFGNVLYAAYLPNPFLPPKIRAFIDFFVEKFGDEPYWDRGVTLPAA